MAELKKSSQPCRVACTSRFGKAIAFDGKSEVGGSTHIHINHHFDNAVRILIKLMQTLTLLVDPIFATELHSSRGGEGARVHQPI